MATERDSENQVVYELTVVSPGGYSIGHSLHATHESAQEAGKWLDLSAGQRVVIVEHEVLP